jgi:hypothetical protein
MSKWDRFEAAVRRTQSVFGFREVTVYEWTETYDDATGDFDVAKSEHADSPVSMEIVEPRRPQADTDATGADVEIDAEAFVRDDTAINWVGLDTDAEHPTTIDAAGVTYRVVSPFEEDNGLTRLDLVRE